MKKTLIIIIFSCSTLVSCTAKQKENLTVQSKENLTAQEKEQIMNETYDSLMNPDTTYPRLTTANYVETVYNIAMEHDSLREPVYYVSVKPNYCGYELLMNDMPEERNYKGVNWSTPFILNVEILKNGKQTLSYRLYPPRLNMNDSTVFSDQASFSIELYKRNYRTGFNDKVLIKEHRVEVNKDGHWVFPAIGKSYYEGSFDFQASFPYEINGWSDGQDLTKLNQKKLEQEVLRFYHKQWLIIKNKDIEAWHSYKYISEKEGAIRLYYKDKDMLNLFLEGSLDKRVNLEIVNMNPIENYDMKFYGDGRVVSLRLNDPNVKYYNKSPLSFNYKKGEEKGVIRTDFYLYLPEGKELKAENFVLIR